MQTRWSLCSVPLREELRPWASLANLAFGVTTARDPQTGASDVLTYADLARGGRMVGPRVYSTEAGHLCSYQGDPVRDLEHARDILRQYADYRDLVIPSRNPLDETWPHRLALTHPDNI